MNKQKAIKKVEQMGEYEHFVDEPISKKGVLNILNQLDEPGKVKVPQFVADWIDFNKMAGNTLYRALNDAHDEVAIWFWQDKKNRQETFARAWLDGYDVEKEKRYLVRVRGLCGSHEFLNCNKQSKKWLFSDRKENSLYATKFTRKELEEAGFGWVFDCPWIEIEEVE